jgi:hypothetical protein
VIPKADIVAWRQFAPWINDAQVEQDLIISRALVAIFQNPIFEIYLSRGTECHGQGQDQTYLRFTNSAD